MTDTPIEPRHFPPPLAADQVKGFIGDLARPLAIIIMSGCCGAGLLLQAVASDKLGLALTALGAMYGAKAYENAASSKQSANVEVAKQGAMVEVAKAQAAAPTP